MKFHAAILEAPSGPFAVLRAHPEHGETPPSPDARRAATQCFKHRHGNLPVAFLTDEPAGMQLLGFEDASADLEECFRDLSASSAVGWHDFESDA
jgi:hypothetical protein